MSGTSRIAEIAARIERRKARRSALLRVLTRRGELHEAYKAVFLGSDGRLTRQARLVLDDLAREARIGRVSPRASDGELRDAEGARRLYVHIFDRFELDEVKLDRILEQLKETEE